MSESDKGLEVTRLASYGSIDNRARSSFQDWGIQMVQVGIQQSGVGLLLLRREATIFNKVLLKEVSAKNSSSKPRAAVAAGGGNNERDTATDAYKNGGGSSR